MWPDLNGDDFGRAWDFAYKEFVQKVIAALILSGIFRIGHINLTYSWIDLFRPFPRLLLSHPHSYLLVLKSFRRGYLCYSLVGISCLDAQNLGLTLAGFTYRNSDTQSKCHPRPPFIGPAPCMFWSVWSGLRQNSLNASSVVKELRLITSSMDLL